MKNTEDVIKDLTVLRDEIEQCFFKIDDIISELQEDEWMEKKVVIHEDDRAAGE